MQCSYKELQVQSWRYLVAGRTTDSLEGRANAALEKVAAWMEENDLKLAVEKTECVMFTSKRGYRKPSFMIGGVQVVPSEQLRYLGVELSRKLGYRAHILAAAAKAGRTTSALGRTLPNEGGSKQKSRNIIATAVQKQLLYAVPIWAGALIYERNINTILGPQRRMALRIAMAYRTVSTSAIMVVAGVIPAYFLARERQNIYRRFKDSEKGKTEEREIHGRNGIHQRTGDGRGDSLMTSKSGIQEALDTRTFI